MKIFQFLIISFITYYSPLIFAQVPTVDFQFPTSFEAGSKHPDDIAIVDLNSDGHMDVVILGKNKAHFLVGDGNGSLEKDKSFPLGAYKHIAIADFNNDGVMDIAASSIFASYLPTSTCSTAIYLGNGGSFSPSFILKRCLKNIWGSVAIVDYNADGILDLVGHHTTGSHRLRHGVALGVGDGTFIDSQQIVLAETPLSLFQEINDQWSDLYATGDLNADGLTDSITANANNSLIVSFANDPAHIFNQYPIPNSATAIATADMNSDGNLDVIVRLVNSSDLLIFLGDGTGQLLDPLSVVAVNTNSRLRANEILVSDFDENGWRDLVAVDWLLEEDSSLWAMLQLPGNSSDVTAPAVTITSFTDGKSISNTVAFTALANDNSGVTHIDFFQGNTLISRSAGPVFTASWNTLSVADGNHILTATVFDAAGNSSSHSITIQVDNSVPTITSIPTLYTEAIVGQPYSYHAVTTGVLPVDFDLIVQPNGMTIDSNGIINWTPDKNQLGSQTLTIEVSNSFGSDQQTYSIDVIDRAPPTTPTGLGVINFIDADTVKLGWASATDDVEVVGYRLYRYYYSNRWNKGYRPVGDFIDLTADVARWIYIYAHQQQSAASYKISAFDAAGNESALSAPIRVQDNTLPNIYHNNQYSGEGVAYYAQDGTAFYQAVVGQLFRHSISTTGLPHPTLALVNGPTGMILNGAWLEWLPQPGQEGVGSATVRATNSQGTADYTVSYQVYASLVANNPPVVSASSSPSTLTLPDNTAILTGTASDDGLPNNTLTYNWSVAGTPPGAVTFSNANSANTSVSVAIAGTYSFKLSVSDGELTTEAYTLISVSEVPVNTPPYLGTITDKTIALPLDHINLALFVSKEDLNFTWRQLSGPGLITFSNGSGLFRPGYVLGLPRLYTEAFFSTSGVYQIQLTITDLGGLSTSTTVQVTVNPPAPTNTAPRANAGTDQSITSPDQILTLNGSAVDDGLPSLPGNVSYSWAAVSGPETVQFANTGSAITQATFTEIGTYILRLTVTDSLLSHSDELMVTVLPAVGTPNTPTNPQADPNAEKAEFEGQVSQVGSDFIIVSGKTIWFLNSTILKFGDGTNGMFSVGQNAQVKAQPNLDGSLTGIKIEVEG